MIRVAHRGLGVQDFSLAAARVIGRVVPFDGVCVLTMDPATLLPTGEVVENGLPASTVPRMTEIELGEADFNKFADLARRRRPAASLSQATGGDLDRSVRHRELRRPNGFGDELRAALVSESGTWGGITLLRDAASAHFSRRDAAIVASLSPHVVDGMRQAALLSAPPGDGEPGLLMIAGDDAIATANPAAREWLAELEQPGVQPPAVIRAVARRARDIASGSTAAGSARARIHTRSGRWLLARGTVLGDEVAVMLEPAGPPELAPLIADAYRLTERERKLTALVAQGLSTNAIAKRLYLAPYTVQDHLKSVFEKVGVGSRGELVARLYLDHYASRL